MSPWLSDALLRSQSDERLVALAREGRERAFTTLVERYRRPLLTFARRLAGEARAEDVVQQALLQAWASLQQGAEVRHASGWLHQIVRHAAWKANARAGDGQPLTGEEPAAGDFESAVEQRLTVQALVTSMHDLPERQRLAILQTELEGRSRQEVATSLGLTQGAVRQLVHRARVTLRTAVTAITPWPAVSWATRAAGGTGEAGVSSRLAETIAGAGGAGIAGSMLKAGAVVVATGALAAGAVAPHEGSARGVITVKQEVASAPHAARRAGRARVAAASASASAGARVAAPAASRGHRAPVARIVAFTSNATPPATHVRTTGLRSGSVSSSGAGTGSTGRGGDGGSSASSRQGTGGSGDGMSGGGSGGGDHGSSSGDGKTSGDGGGGNLTTPPSGGPIKPIGQVADDSSGDGSGDGGSGSGGSGSGGGGDKSGSGDGGSGFLPGTLTPGG